MKKNIWKNVGIAFIVVIFLTILFFLVTSFGKKSETGNKEKIKAELSYLDDSILSMSYQLIGINLANSIMIKEQESSSSEQENSGNTQTGSSNSTTTSEQNATTDSKNQKSSQNTTEGESSQSNVKFSLKEQSTLDTSKTNTIDWETLRFHTELLYSSWTSFLVDLHATQSVKNEDILAFSSQMDNLMVKVKEENKNEALIVLANLYSYIPLYAESALIEQTQQINLYHTKSHILTCSVLVEQGKWEEIPAQMAKAQEYFSNMVNQSLQNENSQNKLSKSYVLLNELNSAIALKDREIFYVKYENLMENLQYLSFS